MSKPKLTPAQKRLIRKRLKKQIAENPPKTVQKVADLVMKEFARFVAEMVMKETKKITHNFTRMDELEKIWPRSKGGENVRSNYKDRG